VNRESYCDGDGGICPRIDERSRMAWGCVAEPSGAAHRKVRGTGGILAVKPSSFSADVALSEDMLSRRARPSSGGLLWRSLRLRAMVSRSAALPRTNRPEGCVKTM